MSTTVLLKQMATEFTRMSKNVNKALAKHLAIRKKQKEKAAAKKTSAKKGKSV